MYVARMEDSTYAYGRLVGLPDGKRPRGWESNNKLDLQETGCGGMDWFDLA